MSRRSPQHDGSAESLLHATLARNLRTARKRRGLTQAKVAAAIGVSTTIYGHYENTRRWPSIETLRAICNVFEVSADTLLGTGQRERAPALPSDDPPMVRRLLGQLRQASRGTRRLVSMLLAEAEKTPGGPVMKREAPAPGCIIIPAATVAEFIVHAVESYGSIRQAALGIGVPYSTLRGWLGGASNRVTGRD